MRLLTRADFDGLACAAMLKDLRVINSCEFVHPSDMKDGYIHVAQGDVLANVPYADGAELWFHHLDRAGGAGGAQSTARVIFNYYGGSAALPGFIDMVDAVDKINAGELTMDEILYPMGWVLLGFITDPRTGLGRFRNFRISNYDLMEYLVDACCTQSIDEILDCLDAQERIELYFHHREAFRDMLKAYTRVEGNALITDLRGVDPIYCGNRYLLFTLYPRQNIALWIVDGRSKLNCPLNVSRSIINKTSRIDAGLLMEKYGGTGSPDSGACQVSYEHADTVIREIIAAIA
ncbi:MAG: exopolyphosphatase [Clostridiales bacterium]|jgi:hypothetical protein|nr:exopolyphosphatase [Clostridiales bacterium]